MSKRALILLVTVPVFLISESRAQETPFPPRQAEICADSGARKIVDKKKLARYLLGKYPFNTAAVPESSNGAYYGLDLNRRIIADPAICSNNKFCKAADQSSIAAIRGNLAVLLLDSIPGYHPSAIVDPEIYIRGADDENAIVCEVVNGKPVEAPGAVFVPAPKTTSPLRLRGKVTDLYVDRSQQKEFQATSQATVSYAEDNVLRKDTTTVQGTVGYAIQTDFLKSNGQRFDLIPYVQTNTLRVTPQSGSKVKPSLTETYGAGMLLSLYAIAPAGANPVGHVINFRPDYLVDKQDNSEILTANLQYMPVINSFVNDFIRIVPNRDDFASFKPILDFRVDAGTYTQRGSNAMAAQHPDFIRVGGQAGITVASDASALPLSFTSSYTWLYGAAGEIDIRYWSNVLTFSLDSNKYFGVTATYSRGIREDTAKEENLWMVGLSGRF